MNSLDFGRFALSMGVGVAMLTGCGGSQPPIGTPGAISQSRAINTNTERGGSWVLPGAAKGDLIFALETQRESGGEIFAYPSGERVGYFGFSQSHFFSYGICSDTKGNVFATVGFLTSSYNFIDEFAHDGSAIATLYTYDLPIGCSVDPTTGNLAVVESDIAIYPNASGTPHYYNDPAFKWFASCTYDGRGDLFVIGSPLKGGYFALAELPRGKGTFTNISLNKELGYPNSIQWDGKNLAVEAQAFVKGRLGRYTLYRVQVSGAKATVLGKTQFKFWRRPGRSTILQSTFVGVYGENAKSIGYWEYPMGGHTYKVIKDVATLRLGNLTISRAPH
jgi:hypothetical protein